VAERVGFEPTVQDRPAQSQHSINSTRATRCRIPVTKKGRSIGRFSRLGIEITTSFGCGWIWTCDLQGLAALVQSVERESSRPRRDHPNLLHGFLATLP
jgi:hypothetical protein